MFKTFKEEFELHRNSGQGLCAEAPYKLSGNNRGPQSLVASFVPASTGANLHIQRHGELDYVRHLVHHKFL